MPVGTAGQGMSLLSGGNRQPVAGYRMRKNVAFLWKQVYFYSAITGVQCRKGLDLAKKVACLIGRLNSMSDIFRISVCKFTESGREECALYRRMFYKIEKDCTDDGV